MDLNKQLSYWIEGAFSDLETAELLIKNKRFLHGLFFCHLTIEKILKASFVKVSGDIPPKTHNLLRLVEKTNLSLKDKEIKLLEILMIYQLEGRYPEYSPLIPNETTVIDIFDQTKNLLTCLRKKL